MKWKNSYVSLVENNTYLRWSTTESSINHNINTLPPISSRCTVWVVSIQFIFSHILFELIHYKDMRNIRFTSHWSINQAHDNIAAADVYQLSTSQDSQEGMIQRIGWYLRTENRCLAHRNKEMNLDGMVPLFPLGKLNSRPCLGCYSVHPRHQ